MLVTLAIQPWATDFRQIPATVIDNGVLRNVPYKSYNAAKDYEVNLYGDPQSPAGLEIGVRGDLLNDDNAKKSCIGFICACWVSLWIAK